jgi:transposase
MYIRKSTRKYNNKIYSNYLLVECVHTEKGPRQRTLCSLGNLEPRPASEWLKIAHRVESALSEQKDLLESDDPEITAIVSKIRSRQGRKGTFKEQKQGSEKEEELIAIETSKVSTEEHREAGNVHVGYEYWKRLGIDESLKESEFSERARNLTCAMVMNRLVHPSSEHGMPEWIRSTALGDILGMDFEDLADDALYRNLDRLYENREKIEKDLVKQERNLFNLEGTIFLYDLTSTYFEGECELNEKAKRGYSRDKRPDCKQVIIGLVIGREGFPLGHEVFEGNMTDCKTVTKMLELMDKRIGLREGQTVVIDRGMAFEENLKEITNRKLHYIVASRQSERDKWLSEFEDEAEYEDVGDGNVTRESEVQVKLKRNDTGSFVLCLSKSRIQKDRAIREKQEKRLLTDLLKVEKRVKELKLVNAEKVWEKIGRLKERYPRAAKYYRIEYDKEHHCFKWELDNEKKAKAEKLDGSYILKTDRTDLSAKEAWHIYMLLSRVENAFRTMKSPLSERPVFHQLQNRVETHIFLCVLAYHLLAAIEKNLLDKGVHTSWATVREILKTHQVCSVILPTKNNKILKIRKASTPEPKHVELYSLLNVPLQIIHPKKTWLYL